jgi:hypothetical protein
MTPPEQPAPRDGVEDYHYADATELLDALSPRYHRLWEGNASAWIFRGHANADWELKATAVRDLGLFAKYGIDSRSGNPGQPPDEEIPEWCRRAFLQNKLLRQFREGLDHSGLAIPSRSPTIDGSELQRQTSNAEPPPEVFPLMALAQHYGLPTMLLDWTRRGWVASYFAAEEAADKDRRKAATHLAVWALYRGDMVSPSEGPYFYDAPGGTNPNLHAQSGLFTFHLGVDAPSLEQHFVRMKKITGGGPPLRRLTLPTTEAAKLLRLLSEEGIHGASMFPGHYGVVRAMRERALWE